jgi:C-terminal processing protease CtpA/Prc
MAFLRGRSRVSMPRLPHIGAAAALRLLSGTVLALLLAAPSAAAQEAYQDTLRAYVDSATRLMELHSVKRAEVDWPNLRAAARAIVDTSSTADTAVAYAAVRAALRTLGDHHSFLMSPAEVRRMSASDSGSAPSNPPPDVRLLEGGVGYVRIPAYLGLDSILIGRYAVDFQDRLRPLMQSASCGWVVDLRGNIGGNMWPMLAGIGPVLGEGTAGSFVSSDTAEDWGYTGGTAWEGPTIHVRVAHPLRPASSLPAVAVLTDSMTASSGEAVAISFRGRSQTRSFGGLTYGPDGSMLFLTTVVEADRTGQKYGGPLTPDSLVAAADALPVALGWLHSACAS